MSITAKIVFSLFTLSLAVSQQVSAAEKTASPKKVCQELFASIEKNDMVAFESSSLRPELLTEHQQKTQQAGTTTGNEPLPSIVPQDQMGRLKGMKCGSEHVAGDRAIVEAKTKKETRLIPFVNVDGVWRFDVRTYQSFYRG